jgi:hypothetical protein
MPQGSELILVQILLWCKFSVQPQHRYAGEGLDRCTHLSQKMG